jgi:putative flippase GtrA
MSGIRALALQGFRFGAVGIWSTAVYLLAASAASAAGVHPQLANALAYAVGTGVSFLGHFHWTFGKRSNHARALLRFLVVAGGGFLLSAGMMHVALEWLGAPVWAALASIVIVVPVISWLSGRYWAFR